MANAKSILPPTWDVPQVFRERLGENVGRQRAMFADDHLLLALHQPPKLDEVERVGRFFWRQPNGDWKSTEQGSGYSALEQHLDEYSEIVENLEKREDAAQEAADYFEVLSELGPIRRAARNLHQVLQHARELVPSDRRIINLRDQSYQIERAADLLYSDAKNALDFRVAQRAEEQAKNSHRMAVAAHRLNVLAAFFFPIVTLTAIFGTNLKHGFENTMWPLPFLAVLLLGLASGFILKSFVIRGG